MIASAGREERSNLSSVTASRTPSMSLYETSNVASPPKLVLGCQLRAVASATAVRLSVLCDDPAELGVA